MTNKNNIQANRLYIEDYELYTKKTNETLDTERETLHINDDKQKVALIDYDTQNSTTTVRYQYTNHLDSASLELDETGAIITYEEYHPFGTTSYRSGRNEIDISLKRYKYVHKELDNETGLYYYGMRYYAPWIARFISVDPLQFKYPIYTPYQYAGNKPISFIDLDGAEEVESEKIKGTRNIKIIHGEFPYTTFTSEDVDNTPKETNYIHDSKTAEGLKLFMKTESGQWVVSLFMKKGEVFAGYEATNDGPFYLEGQTLNFYETNFDSDNGSKGSSSLYYGGTKNRKPTTNVSIFMGKHSEKREKLLKYTTTKITSFKAQITLHPNTFNIFNNKQDNSIDMAHAIGHELFIHFTNKGFFAMAYLPSKNWSKLYDVLSRDMGKNGDNDHSNYINKVPNNIGSQIMRKFQNELKVISNSKTVNKIIKQHDKNYNNLIK